MAPVLFRRLLFDGPPQRRLSYVWHVPFPVLAGQFLFGREVFVYCRRRALPGIDVRKIIREGDTHMPYDNIEQLPSALRKNLPTGAKQIYLAVYNNAWNRSTDKDHHVGSSVEERAHREAWTAVRDKYRKQGNEWVRIYG
jgi:cation transport regulator